MIPGVITIIISWLLTSAAAWLALIRVPAKVLVFDHADWGVAGIIVAYSLIFGPRRIPVGFGGALLVLGQRVGINLREGYHWMLPPLFWFQMVDIRERAQKLDNLEVFTADRARVNVDASVIWAVNSPSRFLSVGAGLISTGLDDLVDEVVRREIQGENLDQVLGTTFRTAVRATLVQEAEQASAGWGIGISRVPIPAIRPDPEMTEALRQERLEVARRAADTVRIENVRDRISDLARTGLSPVQALETVQTERGKVTKTIEERTFRADQGILDTARAIGQAIADALRRK